jgi:hypothetical protein
MGELTAEQEQRLERRMRWDYFKAFWHGFLHPWQTEEMRLAYAQKSVRKLELWAAKRLTESHK